MVGRLRHATLPYLHALTSGQDGAYHCLAEGKIIVIAQKGLPEDSLRGFTEVPHSEGEVHSDRNLYHAVNTDTGEAVDIGEWLKQRGTAGHDLHSKAGDPRSLSSDPDSPDFLVPAPDAPTADLGASPGRRTDR